MALKLPVLPADRTIVERGDQLAESFWLFLGTIAKIFREDMVRGAASLLTAGVIPKVADDGTLTGSAASDDGTTINLGVRDLNLTGIIKIAGTQVVKAQLAAVGAPTINTTAITATAGATYTATEQGMLASLKTAVNQLNTDVVNLQTTVNDLRARLTAHGLTA